MYYRLSIIILVVLIYGCATTGSAVKSEQESAKEEFEDAMKSLKGGYYQEALDKLNKVKAKYPFSIYATEAELKIGDVYFEDEKYIDAADAYSEFVKLHPLSSSADYATFRIALSYYKDAPSDWFFLPPSYEKDQTSNLKARDAFVDFLNKYKGSKYEKEAKEYLEKLNQKLIKHDVYIAKFYLHRKKFEATENRMRGIIEKFGYQEGMDEALYLLGYSLYLQNKGDEFNKVLDIMNNKFPKSKYLLKLQNIGRTNRKG